METRKAPWGDVQVGDKVELEVGGGPLTAPHRVTALEHKPDGRVALLCQSAAVKRFLIVRASQYVGIVYDDKHARRHGESRQ